MFARKRQQQSVEMQMGPMIDMVFLLLVFFMVTAKPIKPESDVGIQLPGTVSQDEVVNLPNEQRVQIKKSGQVVVNDMPLDSPGSHELPALTKLLTRFQESSKAANIEPLVTIDAEDGAVHQRLVDVMNACAAAGIHGVTFATSDEGEGGDAF